MFIVVLIVVETLPKSETIAGDLSVPVVEQIITHSAPGVNESHFQTTFATPSGTASNQSNCSFINNNEIIKSNWKNYGHQRHTYFLSRTNPPHLSPLFRIKVSYLKVATDLRYCHNFTNSVHFGPFDFVGIAIICATGLSDLPRTIYA